MASHSDGVEVGKFCAIRADRCSLHKNRYQDNCTPAPTGWADYAFTQGRKMEVIKKHEAHHLLCVACVTEFIAKKKELQKVVNQTDWCINAPNNMFAMPLWGHTIKWYCGDFADFDLDAEDVQDLLDSDDLFVRRRAPKFANIPQHDYDHNSSTGYKQEVDKKVQRLAGRIAKSKKKHEERVEELRSELESLSGECRSELQRRGNRQQGTHKAWAAGANGTNKTWYEPFSMADDGCAEARTFPASGGDSDKMRRKVKALLEALGRWGSS